MKYIKFFIITFLVKSIMFLFINALCSYFLKGSAYHGVVLFGSYCIMNPIVDTKMKGQTLSFSKFFLVNFISLLRTFIFLIACRISSNYISNNFIDCGIGVLIVMLPGIIKKDKPYLKTIKTKITNSNDSNNYLQRQQFQQFMDESTRFGMEETMKAGISFEHGGYDMTQGNSFNNF